MSDTNDMLIDSLFIEIDMLREECDILREERDALRELVLDMFADSVEQAGGEGCAYWPREVFGERFAALGIDVPLHEWELFELKYEKRQPPEHRPMHDALEKCGMSTEVD